MSGTKFFILFSGRCGGTLLQRSLNNHPNISCEGEILQEKPFSEQLRTLNWVYSRISGDTMASGLKTKLMETRVRDYPRLTSYLKENDVKIIHLYRENPLKHTLSHITVADLVKRTNSWEVYKDKDKATPVEVDLKGFAATLSYIQEFERRTHCFALQFDDVLHLSFERLTADIPAALVEVQEFLRVAPRTDIIEPTKKLTSNDLRVAIANYDKFSVFAYNLITLGGMRDSGYYPYLDHKDEVIERLMELHPDRAQLRLEAGWLALQNGDRHVAMQRLAEAREMEPDSPELADLEAELDGS